MDIGQSNNVYSKKTSANDTGSTGLFKIGDYDNGKSSKTNNNNESNDGLIGQTVNTVKNQAQAVTDAVTGNSNNNNNKK
jgi:hypothetical protein